MSHPLGLRLGLWVVCLGAMVGPFDTTVNTAFPVITRAFALAPHEIQWVVIAFVLAQSCFTLVFGRLGDLFGHRRMFGFGLLACAFAHLGVGCAADFPSLVAWRAVQGLAVGMVMSCGAALATLPFPAADKRGVVAIYVTSTNAALALGPWLGGVLIDAFDWPGVFWFRTPLALVALALLWLLPARVAGAPGTADSGARFDWAGAIGLSGVLSCFILGLAELARPEGQGVRSAVLLAIGLAWGVGWVRHQARAEHPVLRMAPFRNPRFSGIQLASIAVNLACFANLLLLPYVLTRDAGLPIARAGLMLSLYPLGSVLGGMLAGRFGAHRGAAHLMAVGLLVAAAGLCASAALLAAGTLLALGAGMLLSGLGQGVFQVGYTDATTTMLPARERGVAGSLVSVTRLLGIVFGATGISWLNAAVGAPAWSFALLGAGLMAVGAAFAWSWRGVRELPSIG